ncbi:22191_t:CDS:1, partial [Gigaspora rosea]
TDPPSRVSAEAHESVITRGAEKYCKQLNTSPNKQGSLGPNIQLSKCR